MRISIDNSSVRGFWTTLREAVAGGEHDLTRVPIRRAVALLAIPMVLEMIGESIFSVADMFFVSRLGIEAMAAVTLTETIIILIYALAVGLSSAATAMVARRVGEGDLHGARVATVQALVLGVLVSAAIAVPGAILAPRLLALMDASPRTIADGAIYTRIMLAGNVTIMLLFLINAVFRGTGSAALSMRALWLANGINIVLDPALIFGWGPLPELGLQGAAIATTFGRGVGVIYQLSLLARGRGRIHLRPRDLRVDWPVMARLLRVARGGVLQYLISTSSWILLVRFVSGFGDAAAAGYGVAVRIIHFGILPAWGVANAAATLMGQNLGAGQPDRAAAAVWRTGFYNVIFMSVVGALFILKAEYLVRLINQDPEVVRNGVDCLRTFSFGFCFYAYGMVLAQAFNGAGDTTTPTVINLFCFWLFQLPLAWLLSQHTGLEVRGVFLAVICAEAVLTIVAVLVFRRGRWRTQEI